MQRRECQITNYDSRRTWDGLLDTGSTPVISTKKSQFYAGFVVVIIIGIPKGIPIIIFAKKWLVSID